MKTAIGEMPDPDEDWHRRQAEYREQYRKNVSLLGRAFRSIPTSTRVIITRAGKLR